MSTKDEMTINEESKYLRKMKQRYRKARRKEHGQLLDEMEAMTGKHRKSLIRLMNGRLAQTMGHSAQKWGSDGANRSILANKSPSRWDVRSHDRISDQPLDKQ